MKKAMLECQIGDIVGTEFVRDSGSQKVAQVRLGDFHNFNMNLNDPALKKIAPGMEIDITFDSVSTRVTPTASGGEITWTSLNGVKIIAIRKGESDAFKDLEDMTDPTTLNFREINLKTTGATGGKGGAAPPKL